MNAEQPAVTVDSRGRHCPLPIIDLAAAARGAVAGTVITLLADDPAADADVPRLVPHAQARLRGGRAAPGGYGQPRHAGRQGVPGADQQLTFSG